MEELYMQCLLQYLYNECTCEQLSEILHLVQTDAQFNSFFTQLQETQQYIEDWKTTLSPSANTIRHIILYAKANN